MMPTGEEPTPCRTSVSEPGLWEYPFRSRPGLSGILASLVSLGVILGSWNWFEFDRALVLYALAAWLAWSNTMYRLFQFWERPSTRVLMRRALASLWKRRRWTKRIVFDLALRIVPYFGGNRFIWTRQPNRWAAHWPIMAGTWMVLGVVAPLILGWVWFQSNPENLQEYRLMVFGWHVRTFSVASWEGFFIFHGLVWASIPVVIGTTLALVRRRYDRGDKAIQNFEFDLLPLWALLLIALTGDMLTLCTTTWEGFGHSFWAWIHLVVVVVLLLWLPDSKLIHIPQRSIKLAELLCRSGFVDQQAASCLKCHRPFAPQWQIDDLKQIEADLGYRLMVVPNRTPSERGHFQDVCPACRRASLAVAQMRRHG